MSESRTYVWVGTNPPPLPRLAFEVAARSTGGDGFEYVVRVADADVWEREVRHWAAAEAAAGRLAVLTELKPEEGQDDGR